MPVMLYNFGGAIINLATAVLCVGLSFLCSARSLGWTILMIFAVIGLAFALINGLPIKMGPVNNDGKNALELSRSEEATRAFWIQMKVNEQIAKGLRLKDMPDEWFKVPSDESMKNGIIATTGVLACNRLMDQQRFDEADMLMKRLLAQQNGIIGLYRNLMVCDQMYVEMISENRKEILDEMRTRDQLRGMKAMKKYPSVLRTEYVYALLVEQNPKKAEKLMAQFRQCAKSYPYPSEIEGERQLMVLAAAKMTAQQEYIHGTKAGNYLSRVLRIKPQKNLQSKRLSLRTAADPPYALKHTEGQLACVVCSVEQGLSFLLRQHIRARPIPQTNSEGIRSPRPPFSRKARSGGRRC